MNKKLNSPITVKENQFYGVKWDGEAIKAVINVSEGLKNLSELFKSQNINIECLLAVKNGNN